MSIGIQVLSSLHENLFGGQQSSLLSQTSALPRHLNRFLISCSLDSNFYQSGWIVGLFGFHYFEPTFNSFFYIVDSFFICLSLRETPRKRRDFGYKIACFIFLDDYMQFHMVSFSKVMYCQVFSHKLREGNMSITSFPIISIFWKISVIHFRGFRLEFIIQSLTKIYHMLKNLSKESFLVKLV